MGVWDIDWQGRSRGRGDWPGLEVAPPRQMRSGTSEKVGLEMGKGCRMGFDGELSGKVRRMTRLGMRADFAPCQPFARPVAISVPRARYPVGLQVPCLARNPGQAF